MNSPELYLATLICRYGFFVDLKEKAVFPIGKEKKHRLANMRQSRISRGEPLDIVIVGAGIGGLTAALGLRQQGHRVSLYERSSLAKEAGAAIHLAPNCHGILRKLGVYPESFGANPVQGITEYAANGNLNYDINLDRGASLWQHPWVLSHRVALHEELKFRALDPAGTGMPVVLHKSSQVVGVDALGSYITLENGTTIQGDLILGADGVSSVARQEVVGDGLKPFPSGKSAFRFLIPRQRILDNPLTYKLGERDGYMTLWIGDDRRLVMYPCSNNTLMNFAAIHPSNLSAAPDQGWGRTGSKSTLINTYAGFGAVVQTLLDMADESSVRVWTLLDMERIPTWIKGNLALLGDAAHPFLPHQGQGGGMAIEDAGSLCVLLPLGTTREDIAERLNLYEHIRDERAHKIQQLTRLAGADLTDENRKDFNILEFTNYNYGHDEWDNSSAALKQHLWSRNGAVRRRMPLSWGPMPSPRQDHLGHPIASGGSRFTTSTIRFQSSATLLKTLLPTTRFSFASPGTVAEASFKCTQLRGLQWLGGGGYNMVGLYIHGVQFIKRNGSKVVGTFLSLLLEDSADAIITGREELGMPKLYCDIAVGGDIRSKRIICSWRGSKFIDMKIDALSAANTVNGREEDSERDHSRDILMHYRYIPAVGEAGVADVEYAVAVNPAESSSPTVVEEVQEGDQTSSWIQCTTGDSTSLPTLHHIASGLAEIPIYRILGALVEQGLGVDSLAHAQRIE